MIVDINHDSANTGQTNCYDLMAVDCVAKQIFSSSNNQYWRSSGCRNWLNSTYYNGFSSNFKSHIMSMKYVSNGSWYDDYIILPSMTELLRDLVTDSYSTNEGSFYPLLSYFVKNTAAVNTDYWWTRSRALNQSQHVWRIFANGNPSTLIASYTGGGMAPILRVH